MFTCGSLFAGMGGLCLGMEKAGFNTLWANEFNDDCLDVYKLNFPNTKLVPGDIREVSVSQQTLSPLMYSMAGFHVRVFPMLEIGLDSRMKEADYSLRLFG